jgi:DNA-binding NtrC family response regulator
MRALFDQLARVAGTGVSVFISGESGTGKELVAQTVHELSPRAPHPFVAVNCGAISPQLIESEIFGHEKGSFTGATRQHHGHFERAHGGTLLLDEIAEMPLELQVKLLRVLETGTILRIGGDTPIEVDVRIVAATNRTPQQALADGKLREDLYYRLNVFHLAVPSLRQRPEDIALLANRFHDEINGVEGRRARFTPIALDALRDYAWPGNVRQLRNLVQRAAIMAGGPDIDVDDLLFDSAEIPPETSRADWVSVPVGTPIAEMERQLILATLAHCGGRREQVAELLGISAKTLYNRLRGYEKREPSD